MMAGYFCAMGLAGDVRLVDGDGGRPGRPGRRDGEAAEDRHTPHVAHYESVQVSAGHAVVSQQLLLHQRREWAPFQTEWSPVSNQYRVDDSGRETTRPGVCVRS